MNSPQAHDTLLLTRAGPVATLTFNRPSALNVLDLAMMDALVTHTAALAADTSLRVVVLRGAGHHFMAGGDLRTIATRLAGGRLNLQRDFEAIVLRVQTAIGRCAADADFAEGVDTFLAKRAPRFAGSTGRD